MEWNGMEWNGMERIEILSILETKENHNKLIGVTDSLTQLCIVQHLRFFQ
jgi:hypothetical protein